MSSEITLDSDGCLRQAVMTADHYLSAAIEILNNKSSSWNIKDAIELSKVMAQDFHTAMTSLKMQEIRDTLHEISDRMPGDV